jgi:hypothetical protein
MEACIAKTMNLEMAAKHPGGLAGWQADRLREAAALKHVAGVQGVVAYKDTIIRRNGGIVIIMECVPLNSLTSKVMLDMYVFGRDAR